jgi:heme-degrading monooxygenase HmoA
MLVSVFIAKWREGVEADPEYARANARMHEIISGMVGNGIVSVDEFRTLAGEDIVVVRYESAEARLAWKNHPEHLLAQRTGREKFFERYTVLVAELIDERTFPGPAKEKPQPPR